MNFMRYVKSCWRNLAAHCQDLLRDSRSSRSAPVVPSRQHDEQSEAPERRNQAFWQWKFKRRRPVIGSVLPQKHGFPMRSFLNITRQPYEEPHDVNLVVCQCFPFGPGIRSFTTR